MQERAGDSGGGGGILEAKLRGDAPGVGADEPAEGESSIESVLECSFEDSPGPLRALDFLLLFLF